MSREKTYVTLDSAGFVLNIITSNVEQPSPAVQCDDSSLLFGKPSEFHRFHLATGKWMDTRNLQDLKNQALTKIERWRDKQEATGFVFEHAGREWDGGLVTRQRLQPVTNLPQLPDGFFWTDARNNDVMMNIESLRQLDAAHEQALVIKGFEIHAQQRAMKNAVDTATSKEAVEAIVIGL